MSSMPEGYPADDFIEQILSIPATYTCTIPNITQLPPSMFPLDTPVFTDDDGPFLVKPEEIEAVNNDIGSLYPHFGHVQQAAFQGQPTSSTAVTVPHPPALRPRARRGQATDPHSIAERLRREKISERIKALQQLVPTCNKTDRAAMLDEILDYVKFLRLQVKVLSMSRLGGAGAVAQLVADIPLQSIQGETCDANQAVWEKWSNEETEREVAKLMEEDVGAAMQFLQAKSLCMMPISLAALIYPTTCTNQSNESMLVNPDS